MYRSWRHGRGRLVVAALALIALAAAAPVTAGQSVPTLILDPPLAEPGARVTATLHVPAMLADASVQDRVECRLARGTIATEACDWSGALLDIRLAPDGVDYVLLVDAPAHPGEYALTVTRTPFAGLAFQEVAATAPLAVVEPEALVPGDTPTPTPGPTWNVVALLRGDSPSPAPDGRDAARWVVSATTGTATLLVLILATRRGGPP